LQHRHRVGRAIEPLVQHARVLEQQVAAFALVRLERREALERVGERVRIVAPHRKRLQEAQRIEVFLDLEQAPVRLGGAVLVLRVLDQELRGAAQERGAHGRILFARRARAEQREQLVDLARAFEQVIEGVEALGGLRQRDQGLDRGGHALERERRKPAPGAVDVLEPARRELGGADRGAPACLGLGLELRERIEHRDQLWIAPRACEQRREPAERLGPLGIGFGPALQRADRALRLVQLVLVQVSEALCVLGARVRGGRAAQALLHDLCQAAVILGCGRRRFERLERRLECGIELGQHAHEVGDRLRRAGEPRMQQAGAFEQQVAAPLAVRLERCEPRQDVDQRLDLIVRERVLLECEQRFVVLLDLQQLAPGVDRAVVVAQPLPEDLRDTPVQLRARIGVALDQHALAQQLDQVVEAIAALVQLAQRVQQLRLLGREVDRAREQIARALDVVQLGLGDLRHARQDRRRLRAAAGRRLAIERAQQTRVIAARLVEPLHRRERFAIAGRERQHAIVHGERAIDVAELALAQRGDLAQVVQLLRLARRFLDLALEQRQHVVVTGGGEQVFDQRVARGAIVRP
jgi:hypothetical protein